jgi:hypothetical protein
MRETFLTVCPIVRRETLRLFERVEVAGESRFVPFEKEILWLRESETTLTARHRGVTIKEVGTCNDYYGYLSSLTGYITDDIPKMAARLKIDPASELSIDLSLTISDRPVLEDLSEEGIRHNAHPNYRRQYLEVPRYARNQKWWYTSDKPLTEEKYSARPVLESRIVLENPCAYSTLGRSDLGAIPEDLAKWIEEQRACAVPSPSPATKGATL